jgi:putative hydrolase of the HAD superfamily
MSAFDVLAFDADDTLWHNERLYLQAQDRFVELLCHYHSPEWIRERLYQTETRNIGHFGYGVKAFALSMIETAVELTEGRICGEDIQVLVTQAKDMLDAEVELLDHVAETIPALAARYTLMMVTKGDLLDQERKIDRSGLGRYFRLVEVVSEKSRASYERLLLRNGIAASCFLMVGNSLRSDIWPVLELGGQAVYVPYTSTWLHEAAEVPGPEQAGFHQLQHIGQLPALLERLEEER